MVTTKGLLLGPLRQWILLCIVFPSIISSAFDNPSRNTSGGASFGLVGASPAAAAAAAPAPAVDDDIHAKDSLVVVSSDRPPQEQQQQRLQQRQQQCFTSNEELYDTVRVYYDMRTNEDERRDRFSSTYGYPINSWCFTSNVTSFYHLFDGLEEFNDDISHWDVSNIVDFNCCFCHCYQFNQPIGLWNVTNAHVMISTFFRAYKFNQDISRWDVSSVWDFTSMFLEAHSFQGTNLNDWRIKTASSNTKTNPTTNTTNTANSVIYMNRMFQDAISFNTNLSNWDVSYVRAMEFMFTNCTSFEGNGVDAWDVSNVGNLRHMFHSCINFSQNLSSWSTAWQEENKFQFMGMLYNTRQSIEDAEGPRKTNTATRTNILSTHDGVSREVESLLPRFCIDHGGGCYETCNFFSEYDWIYGDYTTPTLKAEAYVRTRKATMIVPKLFAMLSFVGSFLLVRELAGTRRARETKLKLSFFRILLLLSVFDMISSFGFFLTDWPIPKSQLLKPYYEPGTRAYCWYTSWYNQLFPYASGNAVTCTIQGLCIHIGMLGSVFLVAGMSLNCYVTVKFNWREARLKQAERVFFPSAVLFTVGSGIYLAFIKQFNPMGSGFCYIAPSPFLLEGAASGGDSQYTRGADHFLLYRMVFGFGWVGVTLVVVAYSMISIFLFVRNQQSRIGRYGANAIQQTGGADEENANGETTSGRRSSITRSISRRLSSTAAAASNISAREKMVLSKGMLYIGGFLFIYIPAVVPQIVGVTWQGIDCFVVSILSVQGFINFLIYGGKLSACTTCVGGMWTKLVESSKEVTKRMSSAAGKPIRGLSRRISLSTTRLSLTSRSNLRFPFDGGDDSTSRGLGDTSRGLGDTIRWIDDTNDATLDRVEDPSSPVAVAHSNTNNPTESSQPKRMTPRAIDIRSDSILEIIHQSKQELNSSHFMFGADLRAKEKDQDGVEINSIRDDDDNVQDPFGRPITDSRLQAGSAGPSSSSEVIEFSPLRAKEGEKEGPPLFGGGITEQTVPINKGKASSDFIVVSSLMSYPSSSVSSTIDDTQNDLTEKETANQSSSNYPRRPSLDAEANNAGTKLTSTSSMGNAFSSSSVSTIEC